MNIGVQHVQELWRGTTLGNLIPIAVLGLSVGCGKSSQHPGAVGTPFDGSAQEAGVGDGGADVEASSDALLDAVDADATSLPLRCVGEVPADPGGQIVPPLDAGVAELWRVKAVAGGFNPEMVLSKNRIVISMGSSVSAYDLAGKKLWQTGDPSVLMISGPAADADGNIYFVGSSFHSVAPDGSFRWKYYLGPNISFAECHFTRQVLLSPDGGVFAVTSDGYLYALNAADGTLRWKTYHGLHQGMTGTAYFGVGDTLFVDDTPYNAVTGKPSGVPMASGVVVTMVGASYQGLLGFSFKSPFARGYFLDFCMQPAWSCPNDDDSWRLLLATVGNGVVAQHGDLPDAEKQLIYSSDGGIVEGPKPALGRAKTIGADGVIYTVRCADNTGYGSMIVSAYSANLNPLWTRDVGPGCSPTPGAPLLGDDGVLYLERHSGNETEIIAIQTQSPGLARSAMPTILFNNRRTGWLGSP